jgi:hypothetical protein
MAICLAKLYFFGYLVMMVTIDDKIRVKQLQINVEIDYDRKQELQKQLQKLQLQKEIEQIRKRIEQLR